MSTKEIEIKVPAVGESISEVFIGEWYASEGKFVAADKDVVGLETDKATFGIPAPVSGIVTRILKKAGDSAAIGEVIGYLQPSDAPAATSAPSPAAAPVASAPTAPAVPAKAGGHVMPAAASEMAKNNLPAGSVAGTGPGGRVLKEDVIRTVQAGPVRVGGSRETRNVPLSPIRQTIARRLVEAQQTAALLTTFNEVDMSAVKYKDVFEKKYGVKLGFMSFFVRAVVAGLQQFPALNAQMNGKQLTHYNYCDIGIAIGGGKGLVVPVLRNAENMSFSDIELAIVQYAVKAKNNQITLEELDGGTFTITNGGVYGSLLSTPIVNPPQSGVLGMHGIFDRPIAVNGEVVIRPMMYVALTYDHRVVDGREAVSFLKLVKDLIEDPTRLILEV